MSDDVIEAAARAYGEALFAGLQYKPLDRPACIEAWMPEIRRCMPAALAAADKARAGATSHSAECVEVVQEWRSLDERRGVVLDNMVELLGALKECGDGYEFEPTHWRPRKGDCL